jgi:hypothetical protein
MVLQQVWVLVVSKQLKFLHLTHVVDHSKFLSQIGLKAQFDLVTSSLELAVSTLKDLNIPSDH